MRRITAGLFSSLDGVVGEPEDWLAADKDVAAALAAWVASAGAILMGRATYESFANQWPHQSGETADHMNRTPKLVVTTSNDVAGWGNSIVIDGDGDLVGTLITLKRQPGKDILVTGSATLVQSLLRKGLLDELVLWVNPVVKGRGRRLF